MEENNKEVTLERLFRYIEEIRERGDLVFIKFDGEREDDFVTIAISYPNYLGKEQIRHDGNDFKKVLLKCLNEYYSQNEI